MEQSTIKLQAYASLIGDLFSIYSMKSMMPKYDIFSAFRPKFDKMDYYAREIKDRGKQADKALLIWDIEMRIIAAGVSIEELETWHEALDCHEYCEY